MISNSLENYKIACFAAENWGIPFKPVTIFHVYFRLYCL